MQKSELRRYFLENDYDGYVFFTLSGKEELLCDEINKKYDDVYALVLKRLVHRSSHGVKYDEEDVLIKGYVFVFAQKFKDMKYVKSYDCPFRVLNQKLDDGRLFGRDYDYSKWVLEQDGFVGMSTAVKVNEKVKIVSGPLQELEGYIVTYDKRNRNCCVEVEFMNQKIKTWLPFEWTDQNYMMEN